MTKSNLEVEFELVAKFLTEGHFFLLFFSNHVHVDTRNVWTYLQNTSNINHMNYTFAFFWLLKDYFLHKTNIIQFIACESPVDCSIRIIQ